MNIKEIVLGLCDYTDEQERFEFKENWFHLKSEATYIDI